MEAQNNNQGMKLDNDEILKNLPFKTLVQISCCSSYLNNRIRSREFAIKHLKNSLEAKTNKCLLFSTDTVIDNKAATLFSTLEVIENNGKFIEFSPKRDLEPPDRWAKIVGHSAGLVCLVGSHENDSRLVIWNPTLSRFHRVPTLPWFDIPTRNRQTLIRLSPSYAFGFNPATESHEIVRLGQIFDSNLGTYSTEVRLYDMQRRRFGSVPDDMTSSTWQTLPNLDTARYGTFDVATGFGSWFVNGHMHWMAMTTTEPGVGPVEIRVLAFDLQNRRFFDFEAPRFGNELIEARLWGIGEKLCVVVCGDHGEVRVYQMGRHADVASWELVYNLRNLYEEVDFFESAFPLIEYKSRGGVVATLFLGNHSRTPAICLGFCCVQSFFLGHGLSV